MVYHHYSPYQFATGVQVSEGEVDAYRIKRIQTKLTAKDTAKAKAIPTTMTREQAHAVIFASAPNAFISPNSVDGMRQIKSVFGCVSSY